MSVAMAGVHHLLAFLVVALLMVELVLVRKGMSSAVARSFGKWDAVYGASFGALVIVGLLRVFYFEKGSDFYGESVFFWAKMALLAGAGLASIVPTITFIKWMRSPKDFVPADAVIARLRMYLYVELALLVPVPFMAVLMARGF